MATHIIIDGYNLLYAWRGRRPGDSWRRQREELLALLGEYQRKANARLTVVFDGGETAEGYPRLQGAYGVRVIFSDPQASADEEIKRMIAEEPRTRAAVVVTSDREIMRACKAAGRDVIRSADFLGQVERTVLAAADDGAGEPPEKRFGLQGRAEVDAWLKVFGVGDA